MVDIGLSGYVKMTLRVFERDWGVLSVECDNSAMTIHSILSPRECGPLQCLKKYNLKAVYDQAVNYLLADNASKLFDEYIRFYSGEISDVTV